MWTAYRNIYHTGYIWFCVYFTDFVFCHQSDCGGKEAVVEACCVCDRLSTLLHLWLYPDCFGAKRVWPEATHHQRPDNLWWCVVLFSYSALFVAVVRLKVATNQEPPATWQSFISGNACRCEHCSTHHPHWQYHWNLKYLGIPQASGNDSKIHEVPHFMMKNRASVNTSERRPSEIASDSWRQMVMLNRKRNSWTWTTKSLHGITINT